MFSPEKVMFALKKLSSIILYVNKKENLAGLTTSP